MGEKPLFLWFEFDCHSPTEAALLPPTELEVTDLTEYRQELVTPLSSAREIAARAIRQAQCKYKNFDRKASVWKY